MVNSTIDNDNLVIFFMAVHVWHVQIEENKIPGICQRAWDKKQVENWFQTLIRKSIFSAEKFTWTVKACFLFHFEFSKVKKRKEEMGYAVIFTWR